MSDTEPIDPPDDDEVDVDLDDLPDDEPESGEEYTPEEIAKIVAENQRVRNELKSSRERWRPFEQAFAGVEESDAMALVGFARSLAGGDRKAVVNWLAENAVGMAGDDLVDELKRYGFTAKEAKAAVKAAEDDGAPAINPLTAEDIAKLVEDRLARDREERGKESAWQAEVQGHVSEIDKALIGLDYVVGSDEANDVIAEATRLLNAGDAPDSVPDLIAAADRNLVKRSAARLQKERGRREKASAGAPGPDGPAPKLGSGMSRVDTIQAKLDKDRLSRAT